MKKILFLLLVVTFMLCMLCACGTDNSETPNNDAGKNGSSGSCYRR